MSWGTKTADLCRKHGISEATFYSWKNKFGGLEVSEAKRLRALESEKRQAEEASGGGAPGHAALKDLLTKKMVTPAAKREAVAHLASIHEIERAAGVPV